MHLIKGEADVNLAKAFLLVVGSFFLTVGVAYLVAPAALAALVQMSLVSPVAVIEVQGFYGGQMIGLGAFTLLGAFRPQFAAAALILVAADLGGTAIGRAVGMVASSQFPAEMLALMLVESVSAVVSIALVRRA